jgi:hypothetical protein
MNRNLPQGLPTGAIEVSTCTVPGYYWWLPSCAVNEAQEEKQWTIVSFHPDNPQRQKSGWFLGPLLCPVANKPAVASRLPKGLEAAEGLRVDFKDFARHAKPDELLVLAEVLSRACIAEQWFEMAAVFREYIRSCKRKT